MLKHILENKEGLKVGVLVNDVADVNIDAKLVLNGGAASSAGGSLADDVVSAQDMVELANGCVCCSVSDEMLKGVEFLIGRNGDQKPYDHIVIECSGVAEPKKVRDKFQDAEMEGAIELDEAKLHTMVTVVDASQFLLEWESRDEVHERPDLGFQAEEDGEEEGYGEDVAERKIVSLLVEQVECADVIVLNKCDQVGGAQLPVLEQVLAALNPTAKVVRAEFGRVAAGEVLRRIGEGGVESVAGQY